jgi:hypothetical protein
MISSNLQTELVDHLISYKDHLKVQTIEKYDGQLSVDEIEQIALNMPAILVFYNSTEYGSQAEGNNLYRRNVLFQLLVCSDNVASKDSKTDEVLDVKDKLISILTGTELSIEINDLTYKFPITIVNDNIVIRDPLISVDSITVILSGMDTYDATVGD